MFRRFFDEGLAQSSFLLACDRTREAVVIDPRRDADIYVRDAEQNGLRIAHAIETHVHADFVSGARELAACGARIVAGPAAGLRFDHHEAADGERLAVGDLELEFLHTPGHTPEHVSILARQPGAPMRLFTGDTLFVAAVGRPDLLGDELARQLAEALYDSLFHKLLRLADDIEVHPGHGAGSLCGAGIGREPHSTIGQERRFNALLQHTSRDAFVSAVLADLPETPAYFPRMKRINHDGPAVLDLVHGVRAPRPITARAAADALGAGAVLLDLRAPERFGAGHPAGAYNVPCGSKVGYWAGWVLPAGAPVVLLTADSDERQAVEVRRQLLLVGIDDVRGVVDGGFDRWREAGLPTARVPQITAPELRERVQRPAGLTVVDVRTRREFLEGHIPGALHVPVGEIQSRAGEIPRHLPVATICEGGTRSSLAASLLVRAGFDRVSNVPGGMAAYRALAPREPLPPTAR